MAPLRSCPWASFLPDSEIRTESTNARSISANDALFLHVITNISRSIESICTVADLTRRNQQRGVCYHEHQMYELKQQDSPAMANGRIPAGCQGACESKIRMRSERT